MRDTTDWPLLVRGLLKVYSQQELARKIGCSQAAVSRLATSRCKSPHPFFRKKYQRLWVKVEGIDPPQVLS